eukprot:SAG11_NODE_16337_length_550_cov_1.037694_1_plen_108_part_01
MRMSVLVCMLVPTRPLCCLSIAVYPRLNTKPRSAAETQRELGKWIDQRYCSGGATVGVELALSTTVGGRLHSRCSEPFVWADLISTSHILCHTHLCHTGQLVPALHRL